MLTSNRRGFLKCIAAASAAAAITSPLVKAVADGSAGENEFFIFIHAAGRWDVTLFADPRNEPVGLIDPATTRNTDTAVLKRWADDAVGALSEAVVAARMINPGG